MLIPLRELREREGLTQAELSKKLNISPSTVGMWEKGYRSPDYEMLGRIADYFNVTTDYLLGRETAAISLSKKQTTLLNMFDGLNDTGQSTLMNVAGSLKMSHGKQSRAAGIVQRNSGGTNFLATGGNNNYSIVAQ